ncbi:MAG: sulfite exporter TauE/SafE family protein [Anaerolineaceae bacterium]|nr:sulfite exporter TauE/SafE family protein [Anaerolineaceae bacterium]
MTIISYILIGLAAFFGGAVNALAGGGTLITFPMMTAVGIPPVSANVTNTIALVPGYFGAVLAQRKDMKGQERRMRILLPVSALGGLLGGILLIRIDESVFDTLVPYLILLATILLAVGAPLRKWIARTETAASPEKWAPLPIGLAAIYGGYFGAGLGVITLAVLGLLYNDSITRLNALKQSISFTVNMAGAIFFIFSGRVYWTAALVMAVFALAGGTLGGRLAGKVQPQVLRRAIVVIGLVVSVIYFIR